MVKLFDSRLFDGSMEDVCTISKDHTGVGLVIARVQHGPLSIGQFFRGFPDRF